MKKKILLILTAAMMALLLCSCAHKHTVVVDAAVAATCTENGLTEGEHCEKCGEVLKAQETIPATGHSYVMDDRREPTCTEDGAEPGFHCENCGEVFVAQTAIPALGHTEETDAAVEPSCTETGLTEGKHCTVCEEVLVAQEVVPAKGHTPEILSASEIPASVLEVMNGVPCTVCGEVFPYMSDEAADETNTTMNEDGTSSALESSEIWGLSRETQYTTEGKVWYVAVYKNDQCVSSVQCQENGVPFVYFESLFDEQGKNTGVARYTAEGLLENYMLYTFNEAGSLTASVEYNPEGNEVCRREYDYNEAGETVRVREYYADGNVQFMLIDDADPGMQTSPAVSNAWVLTPYEVGLKIESGDDSQSLGIVPRKAQMATVTIVDCLTGETVQTVETAFGEMAAFEPLLDGYYSMTVTCEGYESWTSDIYTVHEIDNEGQFGFGVDLVHSDAEFENPMRICVKDADGNPRSRQTVRIAVTRNNSGVTSWTALETDRAGYVCIISTGEDGSSETYQVAQFSLRDGCILGCLDEDGKFIPIVMDGSDEYTVQY